VLGTEVTLGAPRTFGVLRRNRVRWSRAQIVGVVSQEASNGLYVVSLELARVERAWTIAGTPDDAFPSSLSPYSALFVVARGLDRVTDVRAEINHVGFSTSAPESLITQVQRYVHVVELVLAGIGFIGLAIAALGISNAMLAAIRERRREIGVLKAVGAADRDVRRVFLVEAGTLGFAGGVLGAGIGLGVARALAAIVNRYLSSQDLQTVHLGVPVTLLAGVVSGSTLLALGAGTLPAIRAARMPARQAIGDE
jgi:predicted lysophospholipase L1 biosynthesis ABC-type transport system permease subunit